MSDNLLRCGTYVLQVKEYEDEVHALRAEVSANRVARPQQVSSCSTVVSGHIMLLGQVRSNWVRSFHTELLAALFVLPCICMTCCCELVFFAALILIILFPDYYD